MWGPRAPIHQRLTAADDLVSESRRLALGSDTNPESRGPERALERVALAQLELAAAQRLLVVELRANRGASWQTIAHALGTSRQGAQKRYAADVADYQRRVLFMTETEQPPA